MMNDLETAELNNDEIRIRKKLQNETSYDTSFKFLKEHNGLRPGKVHTMMGVASGGKSTLVRSVLIDFLQNNPKRKVLVWLSEESVDDFKTELSHIGFSSPALKNVSIFSEQDNTSTDLYSLMLSEYIKEKHLLILDNITTSMMYMEKKPSAQAEFCLQLKKLIRDNGVCCLLVAHTGAEVTENINRPINMNDIRGSKTIVNLSEFFYILQRFMLPNVIFPTLKITKHRGQDCEHNYFRLVYEKSKRFYFADKIISFDDYKLAYKSRNVLG